MVSLIIGVTVLALLIARQVSVRPLGESYYFAVTFAVQHRVLRARAGRPSS